MMLHVGYTLQVTFTTMAYSHIVAKTSRCAGRCRLVSAAARILAGWSMFSEGVLSNVRWAADGLQRYFARRCLWTWRAPSWPRRYRVRADAVPAGTTSTSYGRRQCQSSASAGVDWAAAVTMLLLLLLTTTECLDERVSGTLSALSFHRRQVTAIHCRLNHLLAQQLAHAAQQHRRRAWSATK